MSADRPVLTVERLCKSFNRQRVLIDVDLDVRPGEVHALLGANGSGKSTLIKVVAGFHEADGGRILLDGTDITGHASHEVADHGVRFVHQDGGLIAALTVAENLMLTERPPTNKLRLVDRRRERETTLEMLGRLNIRIEPDLPVAMLRPVERAAVSIARAVAHTERLRLLVLDGPTAALPTPEVAVLFELVGEVVRRGASVLYVTHRLDEVLEHADRATVLRDGRRVATEQVADLDSAALAALIVGPDDRRPPPPDPVNHAPIELSTGLRVNRLRSRFLDGISFEVAAGEVLGIAGLNGSGRDEVTAVLSGLTGSFESLQVGDRPQVTRIDPRRAVDLGLVLVPGNRQLGSAVFEFTVQENIGITRLEAHRRFGLLDTRRERRLAEVWMDKLDIRPRQPDKLLRELSGGNQQKAILAKWLAAYPTVVMMDEPTAGVDISSRQSIYEVVRANAATGLSFIVCSSDEHDLVGMADRVLVLSGGRIVDELRGAEITEHVLATRLAEATARTPA